MSGEITKVTAVEEIKGSLVQMQDTFKAALPVHIKPERFLAVAQMAVANNPDLSACNRQSLYVAFTQAAQDGLIPDGREAAIIPFAGKAKYMPMVAGILKKARNSGEISVIDSQVVYENDSYDSYIDEKGPHFKHKRAIGNRGKVVLTYAYAIMKDGGVALEEIDEEQMANIEKKSRSSGDSPWKGPFKDEMRRKSAIRRLGKYRLPNSSDLDPLFKHDDEFYDDDEEAAGANPKTTPSNLEKIIDAKATVVEEAPVKSAQEALQEAKQVFTGSREVKQKPAAASPPEKTGVSVSGLDVKSKLGSIKVLDGKGERGPWRRFAVSIGEKWFGTFDANIGKKMQEAIDLGAEAHIVYKERTDSKGNIFRDVISFEYEATEPISEDECPI